MGHRPPEFIADWVQKNLHRMDGPSQYLGDEPGSSGKARDHWDEAQVRWLVTASWPYEQASGNMSIPAVYKSINDGDPGYLCDRFYLPATPRDLKMLEKVEIPLFGIESKHQARDFDVVATSISYTVLFMNFCKLLTLGDIPMRRDMRWSYGAEKYPMVMVGGQAYCSPGFMDPAVDCVWLGEVEDEPGNGGISQVNEAIAFFKERGQWDTDRIRCYEVMAKTFPYLYFPHTLKVHYGYQDRGLPKASKQVSGYTPLLEGMRYPYRARKVRDIDKIKPLTEVPLLYSDPTMGAGDLEASRGCPAWCSFCRLSWVTKPYRQHSVDYTVEHAKQWRMNMGSTELSPFGPDFPMHTQKKALLSRLMEEVSDEVDTSSMRVDDFIADGDYSMLMSVGGTDSITLGLEGNSQRMRDLIGKGTSDADVEAAVTRAIRAGIRKIKLYMISNMPGEEPGDVMRIVELGRRLSDVRGQFGEAARGVRIQFSWTPLLIEAQTPLQWFAPTPPDYTLKEALDQLRDHNIDMKIGTKAAPEKLAFFQACQRASRDAGEAIIDVIEELGTASWGGFARDMKDRLDAALRERGFLNGLDDLFGERDREDLLGWEFIDTGVSQDLMWDTYKQMVEFLEGTDSATYESKFDHHYHGQEWVARCDSQCQGRGCGACSAEDLRLRTGYIRAARAERDLDENPVRPVDQTTVVRRVRQKVFRTEKHKVVTNDHWKHAIRRAAYRAEAATGSPYIAKRSVRMASDSLKFRDRTAGVDYIEFGFTAPVSQRVIDPFLEKMAAELSQWLVMPEQEHILLAPEAILPARPASLWQLEVKDPQDVLEAAMARWSAAEDVPVKIRSESFYAGMTMEDGNAKEHVTDFWVTRDQHRVLLNMVLHGKLGPYQAYAALLGKASWLQAASQTATRIEFFQPGDGLTGGLFVPACVGCGLTIPLNLLGDPFDGDYCPRCKDEGSSRVVTGLVRAGV
jgi:Radical SAM proteins, N-terminal/Radical SAM superfamily